MKFSYYFNAPSIGAMDVAYAKEKGIPGSNVPAYGTDAVSQYAIALLLEVCHHIGHHDQAVKAGRWENNQDWCFWDYPLIELTGKTMGIVGFGRIGQATGRIAKALGMQVIACDLYESEQGREIGTYVTLEQLLAEADVISLHCNLTGENSSFINKETISRMKTT